MQNPFKGFEIHSTWHTSSLALLLGPGFAVEESPKLVPASVFQSI